MCIRDRRVMLSIDEITLLRLLRHCQSISSDSDEFASNLPKFRAYVKELRHVLRALEDGTTEDGVAYSNQQSLEELKGQIASLEMAVAREDKANQAATLPAECDSPASQRGSPRSESRSVRRFSQSRAQTSPRATHRDVHAAQRMELFGAASEKAAPRPGQDDSMTSEDVNGLIEDQRRAQEDISEELLQMTAEFRQRTVHMAAQLKEDDKMMDTIDREVDKNRSRITAMTDVLKSEVSSMKKGTLGYCFVFFFVMTSFIGMYMFMKIFPKQV
eukprot:TRINITY_DN3062_c0_g1_i1.p1 TRINITY_DN3062_c0_g1~~TRINITY_DN3062_c0_g1_i1.p1  ORF type:complete len:273 (-),score=59.12 TRINITY_DN3062_c0_g1_i1:126-944(-)